MKVDRARSKRPAMRWAAGVIGASGSLALHALLLHAVLWGTPGQKTRLPDSLGIGATTIVSDQESLGTLVFIEAPGAMQASGEPLETAASKGSAPADSPVKIASTDPSPARPSMREMEGEDTASLTEETAGEQVNRAMLFGRYMGQIQARIERAWTRPRTPIAEDLFTCRVQIRQSQEGVVLEVTLQQCNRNVRWQMSLVQAIQRASPLPAPPDPAVFVDTVLVSLNSEPFHGDDSQQGFEPEFANAL